MNILQKIPDYEGGFLYYCLEGNTIVIRDNDLKIIDEQPINKIKKGKLTDFGEIKDYNNNIVILEKGKKVFPVDRFNLNNYLLSKSKELSAESLIKEDYFFSPITGDYFINDGRILEKLFDEFKRYIVGTYETPIGKVLISESDYGRFLISNTFEALSTSIRDWRSLKSENIDFCIFPIIKDILIKPDRINLIPDSERYLFTKRNGQYTIKLTVYKGELVDLRKVEKSKKSIFPFREEYNKIGLIDHPSVTKSVTLSKGFTNIFRLSNYSGTAWNKKGGSKANHKYLERKPNPNGEGYIYLYSLPDGSKQWKDESGKSIELKDDKKYHLQSLSKGDKVKRGNESGKVIEVGKAILVVDFNNKREIIHKDSHIKKVDEDSKIRKDAVISYEGKKAIVKSASNKAALIYIPEEDRMKLIKIERGLFKVDKKLNHKKSSDSNINKYSKVLQGIAEREGLNNEDLKDSKEYELFDSEAKKMGLGIESDYERTKMVKLGNSIISVSLTFDKQSRKYHKYIEGLENRSIKYKGEDYTIEDVSHDGYHLKNLSGKEFILSQKDYETQLDKEDEYEITEIAPGQELVKLKNRTLKMKASYSPGQMERFERKNYSRTTRWDKRSVQSQSEKEKISKVNQLKKEELNAIIDSEEYKSFEQYIVKKGFELTENKFRAKKKISIAGIDFELSLAFDKNSKSWETKINKGIDEVSINGENYKIFDVNENSIEYYYGENNDTKTISINELITQNGQKVFSSPQKTLGIVSKLPAQKVYFGTKKENAQQFVYEIIEAKDLITSHNLKGEINPNYSIKGAQNRDRTSKSSLAQIEELATNMDFEQVSDSKFADDGAPIVNQDYNSIAGNGRGNGILLHYEKNLDEYKNKLMKNAERLGFDRKELKQIEEPLLVRRINADDKLVQKLGGLSNLAKNLSMSASEEARGIVAALDSKTSEKLSSIFENAKGDYTSISDYLDDVGEDVFKTLLQNNVIPENQKDNYFDLAKGRMNETHKERIKNILLQSMLDDASKHWDIIPNSGREGIAKAIGDIFSLKGKEGDIIPQIQAAVKLLASYNSVKENFGSPEDYISQAKNDVFEPVKATEKEINMFYLLSSGKPNKIKNSIREYRLGLEGDIFTSGKTPEESFNDSINKSKELILRFKGLFKI